MLGWWDFWGGIERGGVRYMLHIGHVKLTQTGRAEGRPSVEISLAWPMCSLYVPPPLPTPLPKNLTPLKI